MTSVLYWSIISLSLILGTGVSDNLVNDMFVDNSDGISALSQSVDPCDPDTMPPYWGIPELEVEFFGTCGVDSFLNIWLQNFITAEDECCQPKQCVVYEIVEEDCMGNVAESTTQAIVLWDGSEVGEPCSQTGSPEGLWSDTLFVTVSLIDTLPPVISGVPAVDTIFCTDPLPSLPPLTAEDICKGDLTDSIRIDSTVTGSGCADSKLVEVRTYTATVSDACGNIDTATWDVVVMSNLEIDLGPDLLICDVDTAVVDCGIPDAEYTWSSGQNTQTIVVSVSGTYYVTVTESNGCCATDSIQIVIGQSLELTATGGTITCAEPTVQLGAGVDNAVTYAWNGPGGFTSDLKDPVVNQTGEYMVTVTGAMGCEASDTVTVDIDTVAPDVTAAFGTVDCDARVIELLGQSATAGAVYSWAGPDGFSASVRDTSSGKAGDYVLTVTGPNGCQSTDTINLSEDISIPVVKVNTTVTTNGENGTAWVEVSGGLPPYEISWSTGEMTDTIRMLSVAGYFVEVTDQNGCYVKTSFGINPLITICDVSNTLIGTNTTIRDTFKATSLAAPALYEEPCVDEAFGGVPQMLVSRIFLFEKQQQQGTLELQLTAESTVNTRAFLFRCDDYPKYNDQVCLLSSDEQGVLTIPEALIPGYYHIVIGGTELKPYSFIIRETIALTICESAVESIDCETNIVDQLTGSDRFNIAKGDYVSCYRGDIPFSGPEKIYQFQVYNTQLAKMSLTPMSDMGVFVYDYQCIDNCISFFTANAGETAEDQISLNSGIYFIVIDQALEGGDENFIFSMNCEPVDILPWPPRRNDDTICYDEENFHQINFPANSIQLEAGLASGSQTVRLFYLSPDGEKSIGNSWPITLNEAKGTRAYGDDPDDPRECGYLDGETLTYKLIVGSDEKIVCSAGFKDNAPPLYKTGETNIVDSLVRAPGTPVSVSRMHPFERKDVPYNSTLSTIIVSANQPWEIIGPDVTSSDWIFNISTSLDSTSLAGSGNGRIYILHDSLCMDIERSEEITVRFLESKDELSTRLIQTPPPKSCGTSALDLPAQPKYFSVYPNPARDLINITPTQYVDSEFAIKIADLYGRVLYSNNTIDPDGTLEINVQGWSTTIYLVTVQNGVNTETMKILIQND